MIRMVYGYTLQNYEKDQMARAVGMMLPVSFKQSVEVCNFLRNMELQKAKKFLKEVTHKKRAIPYKRFVKGIAHKKNMSAGRYPIKTCTHILGLLESVEANAQFKGLSTANLVLSHIVAQNAGNHMHYGRQRGTKMKRTHIEVVVSEKKAEARKATKEIKNAANNVSNNKVEAK